MWNTKYRMVLWSGGCDSTLALKWALQADDSRVRTISFTHKQLGANAEQIKARLKIKKKLEIEHGKFDSLEFTLGDGHVNQYGLVQPIIWIVQAA